MKRALAACKWLSMLGGEGGGGAAGISYSDGVLDEKQTFRTFPAEADSSAGPCC